MNNYDVMRRAAQVRFCTYDPAELLKKPGVYPGKDCICTTFLGKPVEVSTKTGAVFFPHEEREGDFGETLTVLDWLCDRKQGAAASGAFCPVSSLPGVLVSGGSLVMNTDALAAKIQKDPDAFHAVCTSLGGREVPMGDLGFELDAFPDLPVRLKFYFADEEFPPSLTFLWDQNILQFIRYETVYYLAGCLRKYLLS